MVLVKMNLTTGNTTVTYDVFPDGFHVPEEKVLLGVGLGCALLFALCFIAVVGAIACRGQYLRKGRTGRRFTSTVSLAYSDFDTYKTPRKYHTPPSTDVSIISSNSTSIYATPIKLRTPPTISEATSKSTPPITTVSSSLSSRYSGGSSISGDNVYGISGRVVGNAELGGQRGAGRRIGGGGGREFGQNQRRSSEEATLKLDGWRYIEPMITVSDIKNQSDSSSSDLAPPTRDDWSNKKTGYSSDDRKEKATFNTKILSSVFTGKSHIINNNI